MHRLKRSSPTALTFLIAACSAPPGDGSAAVPLALAEFDLELRAHWEPLRDTVYHFDEKPLLRSLAPARATARYDASSFRPLLPAGPVAVGDVWPVDMAHVLPFLRQLHPGATAEMHHDGGTGIGAPGAFACLRACDAHRAEIELRAHADFRIGGDESTGSASWFTPAQFAGRMEIDRRRGVVTAFALGVPDAHANVDVNLSTDEGTMADIGRVPRMEVVGGEFVATAAGSAGSRLDDAAAERLLARQFYPFADVEWRELAPALAEARRRGKPMHVVALFGSLLDESC